MNFSKKNHKLVGQNESVVKKPQKHDANLQKNSTLYFQVGLILTLLATYGLFEMEFETKTYAMEGPVIPIEDVYAFNDIVKVYEEDAPKEEEKKKDPIIFRDPEIVDDNVEDKVFKDLETTSPISNDEPIKITDVPEIIEPSDNPIPFWIVEQVPIYPGCEGLSTNKERRKCMSDKIGKLINRKFNLDIASDLGLRGKQRIDVQFKIDKTGYVTEIKARASHDKLEREAIKVVYKIPQMIPGKQRDKNVAVIYRLPIVLQVQ